MPLSPLLRGTPLPALQRWVCQAWPRVLCSVMETLLGSGAGFRGREGGTTRKAHTRPPPRSRAERPAAAAEKTGATPSLQTSRLPPTPRFIPAHLKSPEQQKPHSTCRPKASPPLFQSGSAAAVEAEVACVTSGPPQAPRCHGDMPAARPATAPWLSTGFVPGTVWGGVG